MFAWGDPEYGGDASSALETQPTFIWLAFGGHTASNAAEALN